MNFLVRDTRGPKFKLTHYLSRFFWGASAIFEQLSLRTIDISPLIYKIPTYAKDGPMIGSGIKRGTAELAILSVLEGGALHGYEIARRIELRTHGQLRFTLAALYPLLYRMENRGWLRGSWETSRNGRRRRCYRLTATGKKKLSPLRREWLELFRALNRLSRVAHD